MNITTKNITDALKKNKFPLFKGDYNLNVIGVRSKEADANTFNDVLVVLYEVNKKQHMHCFAMTTDPGIYYRENPINVDGTAVLVPGHYGSCWQIGAHRGQYYALVQRSAMSVFRDADQDHEIDTDKQSIESGLFGINLHRAGENQHSLKVDKWSAGCQVISDPDDFDLLMALVKKSCRKYGSRLSYTLMTEDQVCR